MPGGDWQCDDHWRQQLGIPKPKTKEEPTMAKKPEQDAIDAMKKDAATGMNVNAIAEKHGVTWATAQKYSGAEAGRNGARVSNGRSNSVTPPPQGMLPSILGGGFGDMLTKLRAQHDAIGRAIAALEEIS
jgi:hypothetical protein